ncbi:hypothetical protein [Aquimarina muelleri]|uniref:Uncharacterized protein n=1 Tax=Aquimarina muelleri TaxID=279356 RepID=A0A918N222_9FLAO|nr:hypothetical protein [Aquimarina muelleri]MCX2761557.1 hypothetical protein [Aquimarina muelleri]GGX07869.1 hypothetical protein GCM10007384_07060 [Aquimarina muelleri]
MKTKTNILNTVSKSISKLSDLELVVLVFAMAMAFMYVGWELGKAYARM